MAENMQFPIPNSVLEPYIQAAVSTAITAALGDGTALVEKAVASALMRKVDARGVVSNHEYENRNVLVDVVASNKIQEVAREVISEMAEGMRPKIKEAIEKQLKTKHSEIAKLLVSGLMESLKTSWAVKVEITPPKSGY